MNRKYYRRELGALLAVVLLVLTSCGKSNSSRDAQGDAHPFSRNAISAESAGLIDPTFGDGTGRLYGIVSNTTFTGKYLHPRVAFLPDGRWIQAYVVTLSPYSIRVARYFPNGGSDSTFGTNGEALIPVLCSTGCSMDVSDLKIQSDGKILLSGRETPTDQSGNDSAVILRLLPNGDLDLQFGNQGRFHTRFQAGTGQIVRMGIQNDGKLIALFSSSKSGVVRITSAGQLDTTFANNGVYWAEADDISTRCAAGDIAVHEDGRIFAIGSCLQATETPSRSTLWASQSFMLSLTVNGQPNPSFNGGTPKIWTLGHRHAASSALALRPDGKLAVIGEVCDSEFMYINNMQPYCQSPAFTLIDQSGQTDVSVGTNGVLLLTTGGSGLTVDSSNRTYFVSVNTNQAFNTSTFEISRIEANGVPSTFNGGTIPITIKMGRFSSENTGCYSTPPDPTRCNWANDRIWHPSLALDSNGNILISGRMTRQNYPLPEYTDQLIAAKLNLRNPSPDTTPPSISITSPSSGATVLNTISVQASASDNVGVTRVEFYRDSSVLLGTANVAPYSLSWDSKSISNGGHTLTAKAFDAAGNIGTSSIVSVTVNNIVPDTTAPSVPSGLSATASSSSQINLSWSASTDTGGAGLAGYKIYQNSVQIATTSLTSYQNTGLSPSTSYSYAVSAYDAAGNSSPLSGSKSATTQSPPDITSPSVPAGLTATAVSSSQINLSWNAASDNVGVVGYKIFRNGAQIGTSAGLSYASSGLAPSTTYSFRVAAYDAAGNTSAQSAPASATTLGNVSPTVPNAPSNLVASYTNGSRKRVNLYWIDNSSNETNFVIERSVNEGEYSQIAVGSSNTTFYDDSGLNRNTSYRYRVKARNSTGDSNYSNSAAP